MVFISISIECSLWHCDDSSLQAESNEIFGNLIIAEFVAGGSVLLFRSEEIVSLIIDKLFESRCREKKLVIGNQTVLSVVVVITDVILADKAPELQESSS